METVDHIDENHSNNALENLQWCARAENTRKFTKGRPQYHNGKSKLSKPIQQWSLDGNKLIAEFKSTHEASRSLKVDSGCIASCARGINPTAYNYLWKYVPQPRDVDLHGEIWGTSEKLITRLKKVKPKKPLSERSLNKIKVSNKGRILTAKGIKTKGYPKLKYRMYADCQVHH